MPQHKATLIQDIAEYLALILPQIRASMQEYHTLAGITEDEVIKWIIAEEIELIYGLFDVGHIHNRIPHAGIHGAVVMNCKTIAPLSVLTSFYIKAPKMYVDNQIEITINGRDLFLKYFAPLQHFVYQPKI